MAQRPATAGVRALSQRASQQKRGIMKAAKKNRARRNKARRHRIEETRRATPTPLAQPAPVLAVPGDDVVDEPLTLFDEPPAPALPEPIQARAIEPANDAVLDPYDDPPFDPPDDDDEIFGASPFARRAALEDVAPSERTPTPANDVDEDPEAWTPLPTAQPPLPALTIHAFWDRPSSAEAFAAFAADPRAARARIEILRGGVDGARAQLPSLRRPDLLLLDTTLSRGELFASLSDLTAHLGPDTRIAIVGAVNDIGFFRELAARGVSEYFTAPASSDAIAASLCALYAEAETARTIAVIGARGGVGASTLARNLAHAIAEASESRATLVDLDVHFGAAALDCAHAPRQSLAQALAPEAEPPPARGVCLLATPAALDADALDEAALDTLIAHARRQSPTVVIDLPHAWTALTRSVLARADDVVIVARPDLASLRDAKNMLDQLRAPREGKLAPHVALSMAGAPERPEVAAKDFAEVAGVMPLATIAFDPVLHAACAVSGRMIAEADPCAAAAYETIAAHITGVAPQRRAAPAPLVLHDIAAEAPLDLTARAAEDYLTRARRAALTTPYAPPSEEDDDDYAPRPRRAPFRIGRVAAMALVAALAVSGALYKRAGEGVTLGPAEAQASTVGLAAATRVAPVLIPPPTPGADLATLTAQARAALEAGDVQTARALYERAADGGYAPAHYRLAKLAERDGDLVRARRATERAAHLGNVRAMHDLGVYAARGEGGARDDAAAYRWFRQAAELGLSESQFNLGVLHAEGRGAPPNEAEALFWFEVAARTARDEQVTARITALEAELTPFEIEQAQARAAAFTPRTPSPGANGV